jgi:hypothetical protein
MAEKKEKPPITLFEDLLVKLTNIYSDVYIYKRKFCIPAVDSEDNNLGTIICTLEDKFVKALEKLEVPDIFFIDNVRARRASFKDGTFEMDWLRKSNITADASLETMLVELMTSMSSEIQDEKNVWMKISENTDLMNQLFTEKLIYNLPVEKDGEETSFITIAKQMLPMLTEKTSDLGFLCVKQDPGYSDLYKILYDFKFTHFRIYAIYHALPIEMK